MGWKPDEVKDLPGGWREEIRYRRPIGRDRGRALTRKIIDPNGVTREVWHEAHDANGHLVHQHQKPVKRQRTGQ